jgi:hypothetical protein
MGNEVKPLDCETAARNYVIAAGLPTFLILHIAKMLADWKQRVLAESQCATSR